MNISRQLLLLLLQSLVSSFQRLLVIVQFLITIVSKTISAAAEFYKVLLSSEFLIKPLPMYCLP